MQKELEEFLEANRIEYRERVFFVEQRLGAEVHWFFTQGLDALKAELYLPACTSFLNGIEASLRVTLAQIDNPIRVSSLDPLKTLSNRLLNEAMDKGLPVERLAFPSEKDYFEKLKSKKPALKFVEIVRVRHDLCHGNILAYVNTDLGEPNAFFTPECCRDLAKTLYAVSKNWAEGLGGFRAKLFNS